MIRVVKKPCRRMKEMEVVVTHFPVSLVVEVLLMTSLGSEVVRATMGRERLPKVPT